MPSPFCLDSLLYLHIWVHDHPSPPYIVLLPAPSRVLCFVFTYAIAIVSTLCVWCTLVSHRLYQVFDPIEPDIVQIFFMVKLMDQSKVLSLFLPWSFNMLSLPKLDVYLVIHSVIILILNAITTRNTDYPT